MKEDFLKNVLENVSETPSSRCWETIEQQLSVTMPSSPESEIPSQDPATGSSGSTIASQAGPALQKTAGFWGKVAGISLASAVVATVTILSVVNVNKNTTSEVLDNNQQVQEIIADTLNNESGTVALPGETAAAETARPAATESMIVERKDTVQKENPQPVVFPDIPATNRAVSSGQITEARPAKAETTVPATTAQRAPETAKLADKPSAPAVLPQKREQEAHSAQPRPADNETVYSKAIALEIPNVITPNGDGYNDVFEIKGIEYCSKSYLVINNRSGKAVLESHHYKNDWNGDDLPGGTYFYRFVYTINGIEEVRTGTLTIVR